MRGRQSTRRAKTSSNLERTGFKIRVPLPSGLRIRVRLIDEEVQEIDRPSSEGCTHAQEDPSVTQADSDDDCVFMGGSVASHILLPHMLYNCKDSRMADHSQFDWVKVKYCPNCYCGICDALMSECHKKNPILVVKTHLDMSSIELFADGFVNYVEAFFTRLETSAEDRLRHTHEWFKVLVHKLAILSIQQSTNRLLNEIVDTSPWWKWKMAMNAFVHEVSTRQLSSSVLRKYPDTLWCVGLIAYAQPLLFHESTKPLPPSINIFDNNRDDSMSDVWKQSKRNIRSAIKSTSLLGLYPLVRPHSNVMNPLPSAPPAPTNTSTIVIDD